MYVNLKTVKKYIEMKKISILGTRKTFFVFCFGIKVPFHSPCIFCNMKYYWHCTVFLLLFFQLLHSLMALSPSILSEKKLIFRIFFSLICPFHWLFEENFSRISTYLYGTAPHQGLSQPCLFFPPFVFPLSPPQQPLDAA